MSATIKSGTSTDLLTVGATSKAGYVEVRNSSGTEMGTLANPFVVKQYSGGTRVGIYMASTFRTLGTAGTPHNVATIENPSGSAVTIRIRSLSYITDSTAVLTSVAPSVILSRSTALPTGGTSITPTEFIAAGSAATGIVRGATASDGGGATAITATAGPSGWTSLVDRMHTAVGWIYHTDKNLLPPLSDNDNFILVAGEGLLVQTVVANANTTHFVVNVCWEEYT